MTGKDLKWWVKSLNDEAIIECIGSASWSPQFAIRASTILTTNVFDNRGPEEDKPS